MSTTEIKDDGLLKMNQRTLSWLLATAITLASSFAFAWAAVRSTAESAKAKAEDAKAKAVEVAVAQAADHDMVVRTAASLEELVKRTSRIEDKLDRALDSRREIVRLGGGK